MKNIIISMIAKISKMDAEAKILTAQVEAQSLLLSAMLLAVGKEGGLEHIVESVKKAINTALEASDNQLRSDTELLLSQFNDLLSLTRLLAKADTEIDVEALREPPTPNL
ncbi:anti-adapter protein IraP [Enterobacter sp. R1(2018)]|uniref:anti-adapter protein IraP n=1 Tax=Enterobacter sp. R1(2018) TaxID=2447891 RepID=UPI000EACEAC3|nr:anti-adapter protein IraP [Enterobacter sp. R1(2018)]RKQ38082.1 anti-adapter protein IraP [Enterobacter sp. R1(2018)]